MVEKLWAGVSSLRTTALLAIAMALVAGMAAIVPQGWVAVEFARVENATRMQSLAAWGLTDIFDSAWIKALASLLVMNVVAVVLRSFLTGKKEEEDATAPDKAPLEEHLVAPLPERAVEALRETFRAALRSAPLKEKVEGSRVTMLFETSRRAELNPLLAHLGLVLLVVGAGLSMRAPAMGNANVHAIMDIQENKTGTVGRFDMAGGESFQPFRTRAKYTVRDYVSDKKGLGPAVRVDMTMTEPVQRLEFWVYLNAPPNFDQKHRKDAISFRAVEIGMEAVPGHGLSSRPASFLMIAGLGLLVFGAFAGSRPQGKLWLEADGDKVRLAAIPQHSEDEAFSSGFRKLALLARSALES